MFSHTHAHWNRYHSICVEINLLGSVFAFHHAKLGCEGSAAGAFFPPRHRCSLHSFEVFIINFLFLREGTHVCRFSLMFGQVTRGYHPPPPETDHLVFLHKSPHQTWDLLIQLDWLPSKPQRPSCLCPPAPGFQVWAYHAQLFKWVLWIKFRSFWSGPHVYMTSTLLWAVPAHSTSLYGVYYLDNELSVCLLPIIHLFM